MGVDIDYDGSIVTIHGNGLHGLKAPADTLDEIQSAPFKKP